MSAIGIDNISVFGLPPVEFVKLAAELGCQHISTGLGSFDFGVCDYPAFSLRDDVPLRREMLAALRDTGVSIALGEGITVRPDTDVQDFAGDLDLFHELGARRINTVSMDRDLERSFDQFAALAEIAGERGIITTLELVPVLTVADLPTALAAVRHVGRSDFRLLIDTMHFVRSGGRPDNVAALEPDLIDYIQVSDAPLRWQAESYFEEAMYERMAPGDGELGLRELFAALPQDRIYALEVPLRTEAQAGVGPRERLGRCAEAIRRLLAEASGEQA